MQEITNYSQEIQSLYRFLKKEFGELGTYKVGPIGDVENHSIVFKNADGNYVKAYTDDGKHYGKQDYELLSRVNAYSKKHNLSLIGPPLVREVEKPVYYFVMKDFTQESFSSVDFVTAEKSKLLHMFKKYREFCAHFAGQKKLSPRTFEEEKEQFDKFVNWGVDKVEGQVNDFSLESVNKAFKQYFGSVLDKEQQGAEFNLGSFTSSHIFFNEERGQVGMVDLDEKYNFLGKSFIDIIYARVLIVVHRYSSYEKWKRELLEWYNELKNYLQRDALAEYLFFKKLIGTLFVDYADRMLTIEGNRETIKNAGYTPEENAKKGMNWCWRFLDEEYLNAYNIIS